MLGDFLLLSYYPISLLRMIFQVPDFLEPSRCKTPNSDSGRSAACISLRVRLMPEPTFSTMFMRWNMAKMRGFRVANC